MRTYIQVKRTPQPHAFPIIHFTPHFPFPLSPPVLSSLHSTLHLISPHSGSPTLPPPIPPTSHPPTSRSPTRRSSRSSTNRRIRFIPRIPSGGRSSIILASLLLVHTSSSRPRIPSTTKIKPTTTHTHGIIPHRRLRQRPCRRRGGCRAHYIPVTTRISSISSTIPTPVSAAAAIGVVTTKGILPLLPVAL